MSSAAALVVEAWQGEGSLPDTRKFHAGVVLPSGTVLVVGGAKGDVTQSSATVYDPGTGRWTGVASMPEARESHTAAVLPSGKVLVAGGQRRGSGPLATAAVYDPATNTWALAGSFASGVARHSLTATLLKTGKVLVAGGGNLGGAQNKVDVYDPAAGTWSPGPNMGALRRNHTATLLPSGKVLVVGGVGSSSLATAEVYDPQSNTWTPTGALTTARHDHTATLLPSGKVLVVGGRNNPGGGVVGPLVGTAEEYDPVQGTWSTVPAPSVPGVVLARELHTATLLATGKVLVAGGLDASGNSLKSAVVYDPANKDQKWSAAPAMATARHGHVALPLESLGKVLVVAGLSAANGVVGVAAAEAYVYDVCEGVVCPNPPNGCYEAGKCSNRVCSFAPKQADAPCDDDNEGTINDVCDGAGVCAGVVACTTPPDDCHGSPGTYVNGVCTYPPKAAGAPCDDTNACTTGDVCNGTGVCGGTAVVCNSRPSSCHEEAGVCRNGTCSYELLPPGAECPGDSNACTRDVCDGTGTCTHPLVAAGASCGSGQVCNAAGQCLSGCWIAGTYYAAGAINPSAACQECKPGLSTTTWSNRSAGATCAPTTYGNWGACNASETCVTAGSQSRTVTTYACTSSGTCVGSNSSEPRACTRNTDGVPCATGYDNCSACYGDDDCDDTGTQSCRVTNYTCSRGTCTASSSGYETLQCWEYTEGRACESSYTCDECLENALCSTEGTKRCSEIFGKCSSGSCTDRRERSSSSQPCPLDPEGRFCGLVEACSWSPCWRDSECSTSGTVPCSVHEVVCSQGSCGALGKVVHNYTEQCDAGPPPSSCSP